MESSSVLEQVAELAVLQWSAQADLSELIAALSDETAMDMDPAMLALAEAGIMKFIHIITVAKAVLVDIGWQQDRAA